MKRLLAAMMLLPALAGIARADGGAIFRSHCAACHRPDGHGVPSVYPPLADSIGNYVRLARGREYLVHVVSFGMMGPISSRGQTYSGFMQPWTQFSDDDIAQVLNHVLMDFNAKLLPKGFPPFTAGEVKRDRAAKLSLSEVRNQREALMKALGGVAALKAHGS